MKRWGLFALLLLLVVISGLVARLATQRPKAGKKDAAMAGPRGAPAPAARAASPGAVSKDMYEGEFVSPAKDFRFGIPQGWRLATDKPKAWSALLVPKDARPGANTYVNVVVAPWDKTAQELVVQSIQAGPRTMPKFTVASSIGLSALGDCHAYQFKIGWFDGTDREALQVCTVRNRRSYTVSLVGDRGVADQLGSTVPEIALCWRFLEPKQVAAEEAAQQALAKQVMEEEKKRKSKGTTQPPR